MLKMIEMYNGKQNSQGKEGELMNGKIERCDRTVVKEFYSRHFYERMEDMEGV